MRNVTKWCAVLAVTSCFVCAAVLQGYGASPTTELRYASPFPPDHTQSVADRKWMEKIEKETKGQVKFKMFWAGALVGPASALDETAKGVADVAWATPDYTKSGYDIHKASFLFFDGATQDTGRRVMQELRAKFPQIEAQYLPGLKPMAWMSGCDYQIITKKPVRSLADLKGMRFKAPPEYAPVLRTFGAEGIVVPMSDAYESLSKGILGGVFCPVEGLKTFKFAEAARYITMTSLYMRHFGGRVMNRACFDRLPADVQKVLENNIDFWGQENDRQMAEADKAGIAYGKQMGVEFIQWSKEDMAKFNEAVKVEAGKAAAQLDARGLPGTKMYQEAQRLIKSYGGK